MKNGPPFLCRQSKISRAFLHHYTPYSLRLVLSWLFLIFPMLPFPSPMPSPLAPCALLL